VKAGIDAASNVEASVLPERAARYYQYKVEPGCPNRPERHWARLTGAMGLPARPSAAPASGCAQLVCLVLHLQQNTSSAAIRQCVCTLLAGHMMSSTAAAHQLDLIGMAIRPGNITCEPEALYNETSLKAPQA
jgi:hypothetical protein